MEPATYLLQFKIFFSRMEYRNTVKQLKFQTVDVDLPIVCRPYLVVSFGTEFSFLVQFLVKVER